MVVKEKRIVFNVEDIVAVRVRCNCGGEAVTRPSSKMSALWPQRCPWCKEIISNDSIEEMLRTLRNNFDKLSRVSFEIEDD